MAFTIRDKRARTPDNFTLKSGELCLHKPRSGTATHSVTCGQVQRGANNDEGCVDDGGRLKDLILVLHAAWSAKVLFT